MMNINPVTQTSVAPVRERGLKSKDPKQRTYQHSRSRKGAWIEMHVESVCIMTCLVAPVRERGLKYQRDVVMPAQAAVAPVRERGLKL